MDISKLITEYHQKLTNDFLAGAMDVCRKEDKNTGDLIILLHAQAQMCQTMVFCFMATHLKDEFVAGFYGDIRRMSLEATDRLLDHPDLLLQYGKQLPGGVTPSLEEVIKLFKELADSERSQKVD